MAQVIIKGIFMGAHIKTANLENGGQKLSTMIDIYQPDSPAKDKMISVKHDDPEFKEYVLGAYKPMADQIAFVCTVNAYRNEAYFKFAAEASGSVRGSNQLNK